MLRQTIYVFILFLTTTTTFAQPKATTRSLNATNAATVSQLISNNESSTDIKSAWISYLINNQIESYDEIITLANEMVEKAYQTGSKELAQKLAKVEYLTALRLAHTQEINLAYQVKLGIINNEKIATKQFRLEPTTTDLNKRDLLSEGTMEDLSGERLQLILIAQDVLGVKETHNVNGNETPLKGKNMRKLNSRKPLFELTEVMSNKGTANKNTDELEGYISELRASFTTVEYAYKAAAQDLRNAILKHETSEENMLKISQLLKDSGVATINN